MVIEKKFFPSVKIYAGAPKGSQDLTRRWFVFYFDEAGKKHCRYSGINQFTTFDERLGAAEKVRLKVLKKLHLSFRVKKILADHVEQRYFKEKKTRAGHISKVKCFLEYVDKYKLDNEMCKKFFDWLLRNRHGTTYNDYLTVLNKLLTEIKMQHLLDGIKKVKAISTPARYYQPHQQKQLRAFMQEYEPELWLHVQFVYYCFIRPQSELLPLKIGDILFEEKKILVRGSNAKNDKQEYVAIPDVFMPHIKHLKSQAPGAYVFPDPNDHTKPRTQNHFRKRHRNMLKGFNYDTKQYKLYSWKHTGAVAAVMSGVNIKELQLQLRHHSLDQVDAYLRQLGIHDLANFRKVMPRIGERKRVDPLAQKIVELNESLLLKYEDDKDRIAFLDRVLAAV